MAEQTAISWCDATLNLWHGCTKVSDGCKNCYAEALNDGRFHKGNWGPKGVRRETKSWRSTLAKISARAMSENRRLRVFCQSMSDTFEGPETMGGMDSENERLTTHLRAELFAEIVKHQELDFLLLTKRPENVVREMGLIHLASPNLWVGTSIEDQKSANERIPHLLKVPAKVRFLSCEPLLGPVDLDRFFYQECSDCEGTGQIMVGLSGDDIRDCGCAEGLDMGLPHEDADHWVICGGESGPNARPMHPDWARSLRDQCAAAGVPFHFKQVGEWDALEHLRDHEWRSAYTGEIVDGNSFPDFDDARTKGWDRDIEEQLVFKRVGVKAAGNLLDGVEHLAFPEVRP